MDNDYPIDVNEILSVLGTAEVIVFRFLIFAPRLLVDPRTDSRHGPLLSIVEPAGSAEERFRSLKQLRPSFPLPERITVIHWPKFVDRLVSSGVWAGVERRMAAETPGGAETIASMLAELRRLEVREVQKALAGDGYQTLWERI